MLDFLKKYRGQVLAGVALFAALIFYSLNLRQKNSTNPLERLVLTVTSPVTGTVTLVNNMIRLTWEKYLFLVNLNEKNQQLIRTIKIQNERIIKGNEAFLENQRLHRLLEMKERLPGRSVAVSVIGEDITPWFRTVIIDRGDRDGIREGMAVVSLNGVAGQVIKTGATSAKVLLLTDNASAMAATIQRSRARGVVKGKGSELCSLEYVSRTDDVKIGDVVVTSGIGGVFPKGIPIGEVTMVKKGEYGIFQTITIRPAVNLSRMEELLVIVSKPQ